MEQIGLFFKSLPAVLRKFFENVVSGPETLWNLTTGYPISRKILIGGAILAAAAILSLLFYYLRCIVKKKRENPVALLIVLALICGVFVLGARMKPAEAKPVTIDGTELLSCDSYSLARGYFLFSPFSSVFFFRDEWRFVDDTFSFPTGDGTLIQLSGLRSLSLERCYNVTGFDGEDLPTINLSCTVNEKNDWVSTKVTVYVLKNRNLNEEAWYQEAGERAEGSCFYSPEMQADYTIMKNDGETLTFLMAIRNTIPQMVSACMARQYGEDVVVAISNGERSNPSTGDYQPMDPSSESGDLEELLEPLKNLYNGNIRVVQDVTEKMISETLPKTICCRPSWLLDMGVPLTISCDRLLEMTSGYPGSETLRFTGTGPDGSPVIYTLVNGSNPDLALQWEKFYKTEKGEEDSVMTEYLGAKAYPYQEGWLFRMGTYLINSDYDQYYYLTYEPLVQELPEIEENIPA